jgi:CRISPR-associated protein Csd1
VSWIQKLQETYDRCAGQPQFVSAPLMPIDHAEQQVHIEITLGGSGEFRSAAVISKETTFIPATEESAGRTSAPVPHGLADKLEYIAPNVDGSTLQNGEESAEPDVSTNAERKPKAKKEKEPPHTLYLNQLHRWVASEPDPHVEAVLRYVEGGTILKDLLEQKILHADASDHLLTQWTGTGNPPPLFKILTATAGQRNQRAAVVRWRVELSDPQGDARLWLNPDVQHSWQKFVAKQAKKSQLCMVTGKQLPPAVNHPKRLRHGADGAKLISSNDNSGFTFRGRFEFPEQAYGIGSSTTQKAHSALRWLIARQGYKNGDQAIVAWAVSGKPIPKVIADSHEIEEEARVEAPPVSADDPQPLVAPERYKGDAGQLFAKQLNNLIRGYAAKLTDREDIVIMALDSATPGRMAITYYRELQASEFLERIKSWHEYTAWQQNMGKDRRFVGAPAPGDIAEAAYGRRVDEKLKKATVERLLPCIVDGRPIPCDLVTACAQQAANPAGKNHWEWERCLGIACALVRSSRRKENYSMSLEENRSSRGYLFGRLLAIAEKIESYALYLAKEGRDTTAERLMQRFSDHPASTWRTIELALRPYMQRLQSSRPAALYIWKRLLDDVISRFQNDDFTRAGRLDAEFLLGYHCQRAAFRKDEPADEPIEAEVFAQS